MRGGLGETSLPGARNHVSVEYCRWTHLSYSVVQGVVEIFSVEQPAHLQYLHKIYVMGKMSSNVL